MRVRYTGPAGYTYAPIGGAPFTPAPGDVLNLDEDLVATLGPAFEPVDAPPVFDPATAKKAELVAFAAEHGLDIDRSAPVADLRAAVTAAFDTAAPADGDTPNGQEG
jgi:hypothetical protein